jgi:hypothetical protein
MPHKMIKNTKIAVKGTKIIRIICDEKQYKAAFADVALFKVMLDDEINKYPEIFPVDIQQGYSFNGTTRESSKLDKLRFRKIKVRITGHVYSVQPSFVMPNLIGYTDDIEKALLLRKHSVPYSMLVYLFGKNEMFWYRAEKCFARCSIVGTTIKKKI